MGGMSVRISKEAHQELKSLAAERQESLRAILERAVEMYRRHLFFEGVNEDFARLRADPVAWEEELAERALWDNTLGDGLEEEEEEEEE